MRRIAALAGVFFLAACGGGGGGSPPEPLLQTQNLGLVRADQPSTLVVRITNPLAEEATVEGVAAPAGAFTFAAGALPTVAAAGAEVALPLLFTPPGPGVAVDEFRVHFAGSGKAQQDVIVTVSASVEATGVVLDTPLLAFGSVLIGESAVRSLRVRNPNQLTPIRITGVTGTAPAAFTVGLGALPRTLLPGESYTATILYAPTAPSTEDFELSVSHSEGPVPLVARVTATADTWVPEIVTDFGAVPLNGGQTDWLEVTVPAHGISLSLEAIGPASTTIGLLGLEGPGGRVYENAQATGLYLWTPSDDGIFTATVPNTDTAAIQLVDGGGTYRFRFFLLSGFTTELQVRAIVHNRPGGVATTGALDLNVFLAPGLGITDPANESRLQGILARADELFRQQGLQLGKVSYFQLSNSAYDAVTLSEFGPLLQESAVAPELRLNLFFVQQTLSGGVLGVAARVPGPALNGTTVSGVMVDYDYGSAATGGAITAHEVGHYLGLFHTTESDGTHDIIEDTVDCSISGVDCPSPGNAYLMHWQLVNVDFPLLTDGQGLVILGHPLVGPVSPLAAAAFMLAPGDLGTLDPLPPGWCGTPGCTAK